MIGNVISLENIGEVAGKHRRNNIKYVLSKTILRFLHLSTNMMVCNIKTHGDHIQGGIDTTLYLPLVT